jgi:hypothetical protein
MEASRSPSALFYLLLSLFLALAGWGGLAVLIFLALPTLGPRWLFFFLTVVALTGTALPITYFLNRRFPSDPPADPIIIIRQAIWVGVYGSALTWLQLGRMVSTTVAVVLALVFILIEGVLRIRERARWRPKG